MAGRDSGGVDYSTLPTEQRNPRSMELDRLSTEEILRVISEEDRGVAEAVSLQIPQIARAVEALVRGIRSGGRVIYAGAGTSGRIGLLDALEWAPTFGVSPDLVQVIVAGGAAATIGSSASSEDDITAGMAEIASLGASPPDVVVAIAASGVTPFVLGVVEESHRRGCQVIGLCNVPGSPLARAADIAIVPEVGPEVLTGSTRMKAGTSQKMVLNMMSTASMVCLGKVYSNLMVDMSPSNRKLLARARRIVAAATGLDLQSSAALLERAGDNVKTAIVMALAGVGRDEAERRLAHSGGQVRQACADQAQDGGTSRV
jgi:N-acetylmuramic acid 6-phosphate etherase